MFFDSQVNMRSFECSCGGAGTDFSVLGTDPVKRKRVIVKLGSRFQALFVLIGCAFLSCFFSSDVQAGAPDGVRHELLEYGRKVFPADTRVTWHHYVEMSDGVKITATVIQPPGEGPHPTIIYMSPYGDSHNPSSSGLYRTPVPDFVNAGYAVVAIDWRGTGCSGGRRDYGSDRFRKDAYELVEWIADQSWSTDKVGMGGASARGHSTWHVAAANPPSLAAIAPQTYYSDIYRDVTHRGGVKNFLSTVIWTFVSQPLLESKVRAHGDEVCRRNRQQHDRNDMIRALTTFSHSHDSAAFQRQSTAPLTEKVSAPVLAFQAVYDRYQPATGIWEFNDIETPKRFLLSAGGHSLSQLPDSIDEMIRWFDYWLKGIENGVNADEHSVRVYFDVTETASDETISGRAFTAGYARDFSEWPPKELELLSFNLQADGSLVRDAAKRGKASYAFAEAPDDWAVIGGAPRNANFEFAEPWRNFARVEDASLTYVSPLVETDLELAGDIRLDLRAKVSTVDADFFAFVSEEHANGDVTYVHHTSLRASRRDINQEETRRLGRVVRDHVRSVPLRPNKAYDFAIQFPPVAHRIQRGSRIRVDLLPAWVVTSFFGLDYVPVPYSGEITVLSGGEASKLTLPVIGRGEGDLPPPPGCGERPDQPCRKAAMVGVEPEGNEDDLFERNP